MIKYVWENNAMKYMLFYTLLSITTNILESVGSALLAKIFTGGETNNIFNSGFIIVIAVTGGRWVGSNMVTLFGFYGIDQVQDLIFVFFAICFSVLIPTVYFNYEKLRVKAIARIKRH